MRDSFVLYTKIKETIEKLTDEQKGILFQAILDFETDNEVKIKDPLVEIAFIPIRQDLEINNRKWEEIREARSEAGKKSAEARKRKPVNLTSVNFVETKNNKSEQTPTNPTVYVNVNDNVNVNANDNDNANVNDKEKDKKKVVRFAPPSVEEVKAYCDDRHNGIDPESFIDFYSSKGWKVGNQPMKDWQAAIRTWERRHNDKRPENPVNNPKVHFENERTYDFEAIEKKLLAKQRRVDSG